MLVDANILLYAVDADSSFNDRASEWLTAALRGNHRVALPWMTINAFLRISTHPRVYDRPLKGSDAAQFVTDWLDADPAWIPPTTQRTFRLYTALCQEQSITGNLVPDALLAATAMEHGLEIITSDSDFGRFPEIRTRNPLI